MDQIDLIIAYESGEIKPNAMIDLFAELVRNGMAWSLQGHYGRTATQLIHDGWISKEGEVLMYPEEGYEEEG